MSATIDTMHGVGEAAMEVFRLAGFRTIMQLKAFDAEDKVKSAIAQIKTRPELDHRPSSYWLALGTRCSLLSLSASSLVSKTVSARALHGIASSPLERADS